MKWLCLLFFLPLALLASEFENLMGKGSSHWSHVSLKEDWEVLRQWDELYEKNKGVAGERGVYKIPKVVHFIWLGPRPFPPGSVENVRTWMAKHPDWTFKFWTDSKLIPPCNGMAVCPVSDFPFLFLRHCYEESSNWGEKSDVLRFEILYQEGGVYADHDANSLKCFDPFCRSYDFFCGLEAPHPPMAGHHITAGNGLLGARPFHPVVGRVIELMGEDWDEIGQRYRGQDPFSKSQLVIERTYAKLTEALKEKLSTGDNVDIVFPAAYFFAKKPIKPLYSKHFFAEAWTSSSTSYDADFEKSTKRSLGKMRRREKAINRIAMPALILNFVAFVAIFFTLIRYREREV